MDNCISEQTELQKCVHSKSYNVTVHVLLEESAVIWVYPTISTSPNNDLQEKGFLLDLLVHMNKLST